MQDKKVIRRKKIRMRIRKIVKGTSETPRLSVFRSNKDIYVQLINDLDGQTLCAASSREVKGKKGKVEQSKEAGVLIAQKAIAAGVKNVTFDRNGYLYHGRVKALAEGAREGGLKF